MTNLLSKIIFPTLIWCVIFETPALSQTYNFRNYSVEDGLAFVQVSAIYQDSKGFLWSGGYGGLSRFDGITFTNYGLKDGLNNNFVISVWISFIRDLHLNLMISKSMRPLNILLFYLVSYKNVGIGRLKSNG